jgi:hypothetical protein
MAALPDDKIMDIARPLKQPAAIIRYFRGLGIRAERRPDGSVLVLEEWLQQNIQAPRPNLNLTVRKRHHAASTHP